MSAVPVLEATIDQNLSIVHTVGSSSSRATSGITSNSDFSKAITDVISVSNASF